MADSRQTRISHLKLLLRNLPGLLWSAHRRQKYSEMARFSRDLPVRLNAPLPEALAALTPPTTVEKPFSDTQETLIRELADLAALIDRRSPLGLCLRRSLTRYYYLRKAGYPVKIHFGARFIAGKPDRRITGHAWLTHNGQPYHEDSENYAGFTVMFSYPAD